MRRLLLALGSVVLVVGLAYAGYRWYESRAWVTTDDAYVEGTIATISAKVPGHVAELLVQDNQPVKKGDLLLRIDPRDYLVRRDQAGSAVATAEASLRAARRSEEHTSELQSRENLVCRLLLEKKKKKTKKHHTKPTKNNQPPD